LQILQQRFKRFEISPSETKVDWIGLKAACRAIQGARVSFIFLPTKFHPDIITDLDHQSPSSISAVNQRFGTI
jgi:hypothetical protein